MPCLITLKAGVRVESLRRRRGALTSDGLARTLARARVGVRALTANGKTFAVTEAAIAAEVHQALDVERDLTTKITLDLVRRLEDVADASDFVFAEVIGALVGVDVRFGEHA